MVHHLLQKSAQETDAKGVYGAKEHGAEHHRQRIKGDFNAGDFHGKHGQGEEHSRQDPVGCQSFRVKFITSVGMII